MCIVQYVCIDVRSTHFEFWMVMDGTSESQSMVEQALINTLNQVGVSAQELRIHDNKTYQKINKNNS